MLLRRRTAVWHGNCSEPLPATLVPAWVGSGSSDSQRQPRVMFDSVLFRVLLCLYVDSRLFDFFGFRFDVRVGQTSVNISLGFALRFSFSRVLFVSDPGSRGSVSTSMRIWVLVKSLVKLSRHATRYNGAHFN
ncbi:hypothetical protein Hanom_Chr00s053056g01780871 [Helianthus anomalus]